MRFGTTVTNSITVPSSNCAEISSDSPGAERARFRPGIASKVISPARWLVFMREVYEGISTSITMPLRALADEPVGRFRALISQTFQPSDKRRVGGNLLRYAQISIERLARGRVISARDGEVKGDHEAADDAVLDAGFPRKARDIG